VQPDYLGMAGFAATHLVIVGVGVASPAVARFAQLDSFELPENSFRAPETTPAQGCLFYLARHRSKPIFIVPTIAK